MVVMMKKMFCGPGLRLSPLLWFTKRFFKVCRGLQNLSVVVFAKSGNICQTLRVKSRFNTVSSVFCVSFLPHVSLCFNSNTMFEIFVLLFCNYLLLIKIFSYRFICFIFPDFQIFILFILLPGGVVVIKFSTFYNSQYVDLFVCGLMTISVMYTS